MPSSTQMLSSSRNYRIGFLLLILVVAVLVYLKWTGAYFKYQAAVGSNSMRESLYLAGDPTWRQPFIFTVAYFRDIWWATLLGLLGGGALMAFFPAGIFRKSLKGEGVGKCLVGAMAASPLMMCACCSSLLVPSLRQKGAGIGPTLAFWMASPSLHVGGIAIIATFFSWEVALFRLLLAFGTTVGVASFLGRHMGSEQTSPPSSLAGFLDSPEPSSASFIQQWIKTTLRLARELLPVAVAATFVIGLFKTYFFAEPFPLLQETGLIHLLVVSLLGTLMLVPTLGEIPLVLSLMQLGLSSSSGVILLYSLPVVNLPSLFIVGRYLGWKVALAIGLMVTGVSFAGGLTWQLFFS